MEKGEQWNKIKDLFDAAVELQPNQRDAFLRSACGTDLELRAEIESLVSAYQKADNLSHAPWRQQRVEDPCEQKFIGAYRLEAKLGEGGMGQVWLAEQTAPVKRKVALKLITVGMYDGVVLKRFQSERQSLAIMDHPSIAKVFEAGATPDGQPYFVMEYVPGVPITDYCDQKRLKIRERLELLIKVCEGVQHAHQKAIIHRDLKPANILVVEVDGKPMPRIIDFGLAKASVPQIVGDSMLTQVGSFVGTPGYMSPEQGDPSVVDVDTRTDVYSLGAVLYVLLTGFLPIETIDWRKQRFDEFLWILREEDPPRPSAKIGMEKDCSSARAEARGSEPKHLVSLLHGDLDWITMKALEKDRARRYGSPSELAADLRRHLKHEPVVARPASTGYRLQKYVRRHRVGVAVAAGLVLLLAAFAMMQALQLRRITRERDRASRITEFMTNMFKGSDPSEAGNSITTREILEKASKEIDTSLAKDPEVQAQMMYLMGDVYGSLGLYSQAQSLLARAVEIQQRVLGSEHPDTLRSRSALGWTLRKEGHYAEAERLFRETLEIRRRVLGAEHRDTLISMRNLARILSLEGYYPEADKLARETLAIQRRVLGPEHPDTLNSVANLAFILEEEGYHEDRRHYPEAEKLARETVAIQRRILGPEHPDSLNSMSYVALILADRGQYSEAEKLQRETVTIQRRVLGPEHPDTLLSMNYLAWNLMEQGHYSEAEKLQRETRAIQQRVLGSEHPDTANSTYNLGCLAARQGHREQALSLLGDAVDHGLEPSQALAMEKDSDLRSLRGDSRFAALVARAKKRATAQRVN